MCLTQGGNQLQDLNIAWCSLIECGGPLRALFIVHPHRVATVSRSSTVWGCRWYRKLHHNCMACLVTGGLKASTCPSTCDIVCALLARRVYCQSVAVAATVLLQT